MLPNQIKYLRRCCQTELNNNEDAAIFCYFFGTFVATVSHIHTGLKFFQTHSLLFLASPGLLLVNKWPPMFLTGLHSTAAAELDSICASYCFSLSGELRSTPARHRPVNLTFGMLNTRSAVNKAPLLHSLIADHDLSLLALTETWIKTDDPR